MAKKQFDARATFDLPSDLLDRVDREAESNMKTRSDVLREATLEHMERKEKKR